MILQNKDFASFLKFNVLMLHEDTQITISNYIQDKLAIPNKVTIFCQLSKRFRLTKFGKKTLYYIERCFAMVVESNNFLELDYDVVAKLLADSKLNIDTEIEIFKAADKWLTYNIENRSKFAKRLLLKVRLPLLSDRGLQSIINNPSSFSNNENCVAMLTEVLVNKENFIKNNSSLPFTHRFCTQKTSKIFICGGYDTESDKDVGKEVKQIDGNNFKNLKMCSPMIKSRRNAKAVCLKGKLYTFGGCYKNNQDVMSVGIYSPLDDCWSDVPGPKGYRFGHCICSFMDKIYIIGGKSKTESLSDSLEFDPSCNGWKAICRPNYERNQSACTVFEGRIVVSGGRVSLYRNLNTVESYDVAGNEWSPMADMVNIGIRCHSMLVVKNKMFVVGILTNRAQSSNFEVYDSVCKRFTAVKTNLGYNFGYNKKFNSFINFQHFRKAINVGSKIFVYRKIKSPIVICYDVEKDEWSEELCEVTENLFDYSIVSMLSC